MTTIKNLEKPTIAFNQIIREINWALLASITVHGIFFSPSSFPDGMLKVTLIVLMV